MARYTDRELLIGFDGGVPQLPEAENSAYRSSLPDGTYDLLLTGQYTAVDGGTMAAGHLRQRLAFTDAEVGNLQPGDVIPVSRYRDTGSAYGERYNAYEDLTVESAVYGPSGSSVEVNGMFFFIREDGVWYMEELEGFDQVTPGRRCAAASGRWTANWSSMAASSPLKTEPSPMRSSITIPKGETRKQEEFS